MTPTGATAVPKACKTVAAYTNFRALLLSWYIPAVAISAAATAVDARPTETIARDERRRWNAGTHMRITRMNAEHHPTKEIIFARSAALNPRYVSKKSAFTDVIVIMEALNAHTANRRLRSDASDRMACAGDDDDDDDDDATPVGCGGGGGGARSGDDDVTDDDSSSESSSSLLLLLFMSSDAIILFGGGQLSGTKKSVKIATMNGVIAAISSVTLRLFTAFINCGPTMSESCKMIACAVKSCFLCALSSTTISHKYADSTVCRRLNPESMVDA